jgi:hypothetical protein
LQRRGQLCYGPVNLSRWRLCDALESGASLDFRDVGRCRST